MMTDLFEKSIATLELPRVLEQLAACASTQEGKERCLALRPMYAPTLSAGNPSPLRVFHKKCLPSF